MTTVMPEDQSGGEASRYPLPLYLNQKYVFDVLSMMERGSRNSKRSPQGGLVRWMPSAISLAKSASGMSSDS